jgi:hypothetical protein
MVIASYRTDCAFPAADKYDLLSSWENVAIKMMMMMMVMFGHRHMRVFRALSFFANVPYEMPVCDSVYT